MNEEIKQAFLELVTKRFDKNADQNLIDFASFLLEIGVIQHKTIARYMVLTLYPSAICKFRKHAAIQEIADQTGIPYKTVYYIVQNPQKFAKKNDSTK